MKSVLLLACAVGLVGFVAAGTLPPVFGLGALALVAAAVYWALRDRIHEILLVFASAFLVLVVIDSPAVRLSDPHGVKRLEQVWMGGTFDERLPVILHLVFDEMMSPGAIDGRTGDGAATRDAFYKLGERYGLRTFDSVYSRSFFSGVSLPNLFNAEYLGHTGASERSPMLMATPQNAYFDDLARQGYRTVVFQTSLLDFCGNRHVDLCDSFPSYDPGVLRSDALDLRARVVHVTTVLLRSYEPGYVPLYGRRWLTGSDPQEDAEAQKMGTQQRFDVEGFPAWFDRFVGFVERVPRGTHVFAHFMVPHAPYRLTPDCTIAADGGAGYYLAERFPAPTDRAAARQGYYRLYLLQLQCVVNRLDRFFEAVRRNPALRDARIVIHGDHGSRISAGNRIEDHRPEDYISNYATYFAVAAPGVQPGTDCRFLSLAEAFRDHIGSTAPPAIDRTTPPVLVRSKERENVLVESPMPRFGCAASEPAASR